MDRLVWQLAGILAIHPGEFTLRELITMAEARSQQLWSHTSSVMALLANIHRDLKRSRSFKPSDFNPHAKPSPPPLPKVGIQVLKQVFVDRRVGEGAF